EHHYNDFVACLPYLGSSIKILEDQLDELIVETATKRKQWPKKILVHTIQTMKAEQEMLKLYQPVVTPEEIRPQPSQDTYIADLKQVTEVASEQIGEAMKAFSNADLGLTPELPSASTVKPVFLEGWAVVTPFAARNFTFT
ncbi:hypothetical protein ASZ78_000096, partial [Callipepla squamata]